jgi:hypothetical protein
MIVGQKRYVVAGSTRDGNTEYVGFDSASGGYPYASAVLVNTTADLAKAISWMKDAEKNLHIIKNPKVFSYEIKLSEVDTSAFEANEVIVKNMIEGLSDEQIEILKRQIG